MFIIRHRTVHEDGRFINIDIHVNTTQNWTVDRLEAKRSIIL